jgi:(p)ppGpp synthase/HD superfamily hydrolase
MNNTGESDPANFLHLTDRFTHAIDYARQVHVNYRKGTSVPVLAHLLGVASLVLGESGYVRFVVTEDMVIGALLHDAVEDEGGLPRLRDIEANFGKEVANIVEGCSDSVAEDSSRKQEWEVRKTTYINRLQKVSEGTLLVSVADKVYNAHSILEDYRELGTALWSRFKRGRKEQLWYFAELIKVYEKKDSSSRLTKELKRTVDELARLSAVEGNFTQ